MTFDLETVIKGTKTRDTTRAQENYRKSTTKVMHGDDRSKKERVIKSGIEKETSRESYLWERKERYEETKR